MVAQIYVHGLAEGNGLLEDGGATDWIVAFTRLWVLGTACIPVHPITRFFFLCTTAAHRVICDLLEHFCDLSEHGWLPANAA